MKNKLIFRILGALASALIIVSVFVPFVSVTGYSFSLWGSNMETNSLYLPIMIIAFGVIGVIFFSLNIKTEFAYMSTGAIIFFLVVQTIDILDQGVFNTLSVGYYCMVIGTLLTGLMAFIMNLRGKQKIETEVPNEINQMQSTSVLSQIDGLYSNDNQFNSIPTIQPVEQSIEPISVQPIDNMVSIQPVEQSIEPIPVQPIDNMVPIQPIEQSVEPIPVQPIDNMVTIQPVEQSVESIPVQPIDNMVSIQPVEQSVESIPVQPIDNMVPIQPMDPIPFEQPQPVNPILEQFSQSSVNPIVQEFSTPVSQGLPEVNQQSVTGIVNTPTTSFDRVEPVIPINQNFVNVGPQIEPQPNLNQQSQVVPQFNQNTTDVDIFGQPINK